MIQERYIRWLYYTGLLGIIAGISLSKPAVSVGTIICGVAWLCEPALGQRTLKALKHPFFLVSLLLILLHLCGLLWSDNLSYGLKDIKTKLPVIVLPLIFLSSQVFNLQKEITYIKLVFIASLVVCTLLSFGIYFHYIKPVQFDPTDMRTMIFGVSGVRLALFICLSLCFLLYDAYTQQKRSVKLICLGLIAWFLFFLNFIESGTAMVFLIALGSFTFVYFVWKRFTHLKRWLILGTGCLVLVVSGWVIYHHFTSMLEAKPDPTSATHTKYGEKYVRVKHLLYRENGYIVGENVARKEMEEAWNKRSSFKYREKDKKDQPVWATLIRYLNSKGSPKDREAVEKLTATDIRNIENGIGNYYYTTMSGWQKRMLQIIFEFETYRRGLDPFGNSVTQRFEFWRIGYGLFMLNPVIGIGTGDVKDGFEKEYVKYSFAVNPKFRLRAHNQYLTMAVAFGILGMVIFFTYAFSLLWTGAWKSHSYFSLAFLLIMLLSFLSEDTLETQSGVTFIVFFHTLFHTGKIKV